MNTLFRDGPEYEARKKSSFSPPVLAIKDVHAAVPRHLFERSTMKSLYYVGRHVAITAAFYLYATRIDFMVLKATAVFDLGNRAISILSFSLWALYWFWQGISFTGLWTLGTYHDLCIIKIENARVLCRT